VLHRPTFLTIGLLLFGWIGVQAQDFHYSQFFNAPVYLNPALTGVFNGDLRLQGNYRDQWTDVPVSYRTFSLMADKKFIRRTDRSSFFAAGLGLNYDQAGDGRLSWSDLNLNASYTHYLSEGMFLTLGGRAAVAQRRFEPEALRFADQFNFGTGAFDPAFRTGEDFARTNHVFPDFSVGVNFHWQALDRYQRYDYKEERSKIDVGIALMHLTTPDQTFIEDIDVPLYRRFSAYAQGVLQLNAPLDLVGGITGQFQGPYREYVAMGGLRVHLNTEPGKQLSLQGALGYRFAEFGDAFYPMLQLEYNAFRVGFSYDINISDFNVATQRNGGPELSVRYVFKKVRPVPSRRFCPLI
jgi:type IX secretion system PorP/SprF family membrane protein